MGSNLTARVVSFGAWGGGAGVIWVVLYGRVVICCNEKWMTCC